MISTWRPGSGWIPMVVRTGVAVASILGFLGHAAIAYAQQDVVITTTGERLVGEIIRVEKDVLTFSTGYSDADFKITWDKIASIESTRQFLVETFDGKRVSGPLKPDPEKKPVVQIADTRVQLPDVSAMEPFERAFWSRFDAGLDLGYSMTRTNSAKQLSLGTNLSYRDEHHFDVLFANIFRSSQENAPETERWDRSVATAEWAFTLDGAEARCPLRQRTSKWLRTSKEPNDCPPCGRSPASGIVPESLWCSLRGPVAVPPALLYICGR